MVRRSTFISVLTFLLGMTAFAVQPVAAQQIPPGMTLEDLTPAQRAQLLARLQQAGVTGTSGQAQASELQLPANLVPEASMEAGISQVDTTQFYVEKPYDFAAIGAETDSLRQLKIFGTDIFQRTGGMFDPPTFGPVGPDYQLGPGDEIVITMWGTYQNLWNLSIAREGFVLIPVSDVGQVQVSGLTLEAAKRRLLAALTPSFEQLNNGRPGAQAFLDVSLGQLRGITVYVAGDVQQPAAYTLSSISTAFTALYAANGPSNTGSMRDIRIIRGNRDIGTLDAYDFVLNGDRSKDIRLQNEDIVFVQPVGKRVAITGRVLRPAVYEAKGDERLADLVRYAGGPTPSALLSRALVSRIVPYSERTTPWVQIVVEVDLGQQIAEPAASLEMANGDVLRVLGIPDDRRNLVVVEGAVWNPGRLELTEGMTIRDAIQRAGGLREEALPTRVDVIRTNPDETTTEIATILASAMTGDPANNTLLAGRDRIRVYSIHDVYPRDNVTILGQVKNPGTYLLHENMTMTDLIARAGGLKKDAWTEWADVARLRLGADGSVSQFQVFKVPVDTTYTPGEDHEFQLHDFDQVFIRQIPKWQTERNVTLEGEVLFPGQYAIQRDDETLAQVVSRAGGLTQYAYPDGARFTRTREDIGRINIRLSNALRDPNSLDNLVLQPGDRLYVPPRVPVVQVRGAVEYPTSVLYVKGKGPGYYIGQAGGYAENADKSRTRVVLPNGSVWHGRWSILPDPPVEPGTEITVPQKPESAKDIWETIRDTTAVLSSLTTVLLLIWQINR